MNVTENVQKNVKIKQKMQLELEFTNLLIHNLTRMWANAQPDGRPAEHRWRPLFNAAKFG